MIKTLPKLTGLALMATALTLLSPGAHAGNLGTITYAPMAVVPGLQGIGLLILAVLLGVIAWRLLRQPHPSNRLAALAALGVGVTAASLGGVQIFQDVNAITAPIQLNNPAGGTADVPTFYQEYINSSGVALNIVSVTNPFCDVRGDGGEGVDTKASTNGIPSCFALPTLQNGESCFTDPCVN